MLQAELRLLHCAWRVVGSCYRRTLSTFREDMMRCGDGSVDLTKDDTSGIATLLLNNTARKNSLTGKMMVDLDRCVTELESWSHGKAVILAGAGDTFCSGGELQTVHAILSRGEEMCGLMQNITSRLYNLPMISVAAIAGHALGGGAELTTACDFRIMKSSAKIGFVQVRLNVTTGWGGGPRLVKLIGRKKALKLLASAQVLNAERAVKLGYVDDVVDDDCDVVESARDWLSWNVVSIPETTRVVKQVVVSTENGSIDDGYDKERTLFADTFGSTAHVQALKAASKFNKK